VAQKVSHYQIIKNVLDRIKVPPMRSDLFVKFKKMIKHYNIIRRY